ncbi:phosphoethanolamine transferase [Thalassotalea sediminis]|uniref:phosphoethanolamine transferase n=1 Tax=Thalassotalea sediminis TaxID=1759089 RepID=UPI0025734472|nr:phosphoethanolamine transferase [Thalassotalea sediminis]
MSSKLYTSFSLFVIITLFLLVPDMLYGQINSHYIAGFDGKSITIATLLALTLTISPAYKLTYIILSVLFFWQITQIMYFHYYGSFYSAFDITLMLAETSDAITGFWDVVGFLLLPAFFSVTCFVITVISYKCLRKNTYTLKGVPIILLLICIAPFIQSITAKSSQKFQPNIAQLAVKNGLYSFSYFFARQAKVLSGIESDIATYLPYEIVPLNNTEQPNVILIMGESLSYLNLGLFGYHRETTPDLRTLIDDPSFIVKPSIASAVSTRVSLSLFFNTVYEPDNAAHLSKMDTSLFRLAKRAGYQTFYISTQNNAGGLTYALSPTDIDTWKENKHLSDYESQYDDRLVDELKTINLEKAPTFVTLHMRSAHTPYIDNYPKHHEVFPVEEMSYRDYMINSYDNSVIFTQKIIKNIIDYAKTQTRPTYVFFTADHGELMDLNGRFGHNTVDIDAAKVPFFFYGANVDKHKIQALDNALGCLPNHYQISKQVAETLGFIINNPNQKDDTFYLNGTDTFGLAGYMQYSLKTLEKTICTEHVLSPNLD